MGVTLKDLLVRTGRELTFTRTTRGAYDPATLVSSETDSTFTGIGAQVTFRTAEIDGERIQFGDKKLIMADMSTAPSTGDTVSVSGSSYRVMSVSPTSPAGTVLAYTLHLRI